MKFTILYGTESGNAELIAEDLSAALSEQHEDVEVHDLQNTDPASITPDRFYLVVCSTHGEGDLPNSAIPFAEAFDATPPDLAGVRYAMFGLGDTFYEETYSQGSEHIDRRFAAQGAERDLAENGHIAVYAEGGVDKDTVTVTFNDQSATVDYEEPPTTVTGLVRVGGEIRARALVQLDGPGLSWKTASRADGSYAFHEVPSGAYSLTFAVDGAAPRTVTVDVP